MPSGHVSYFPSRTQSHQGRTVTGNDQELVVVVQVVYHHVREGRDDLSLWGQLGALLELKVSDGARQGEIAVDASKVNEAAGGRDAGLLDCRGRNPS